MIGINSPDSIQLVWNSASDTTCGSVTYHLELRATADQRFIIQDTTKNQMYTFPGLSPDSNYTAYIYGSNEAGNGQTAVLPVITASASNNGKFTLASQQTFKPALIYDVIN